MRRFDWSELEAIATSFEAAVEWGAEGRQPAARPAVTPYLLRGKVFIACKHGSYIFAGEEN
tara:strand:- start:128 stop:310 length:183 start_codon:yes stop_codon:yes gene_type:complete